MFGRRAYSSRPQTATWSRSRSDSIRYEFDFKIRINLIKFDLIRGICDQRAEMAEQARREQEQTQVNHNRLFFAQ